MLHAARASLPTHWVGHEQLTPSTAGLAPLAMREAPPHAPAGTMTYCWASSPHHRRMTRRRCPFARRRSTSQRWRIPRRRDPFEIHQLKRLQLVPPQLPDLYELQLSRPRQRLLAARQRRVGRRRRIDARRLSSGSTRTSVQLSTGGRVPCLLQLEVPPALEEALGSRPSRGKSRLREAEHRSSWAVQKSIEVAEPGRWWRPSR